MYKSKEEPRPKGIRDVRPDVRREPLTELRQIAGIAGLRIWEPTESAEPAPLPAPLPAPPREPTDAIVAWNPPTDADRGHHGRPDALASNVCRSSSRTFEVVRAEANGIPSPVQNASGAPCRCVVRGKEQRLALPGHDCEMCRRFYAAAGVGPLGPKSSRHRSEHAPTSTPPGHPHAMTSTYNYMILHAMSPCALLSVQGEQKGTSARLLGLVLSCPRGVFTPGLVT